jgi:hypothetical protein
VIVDDQDACSRLHPRDDTAIRPEGIRGNPQTKRGRLLMPPRASVPSLLV